MILKLSGLPFSFYTLLIDDSVTISDGFAYRPDRVVESVYGENMVFELFCNEANNTSPLSLAPGVAYLTPSLKFMRQFLEVS